jgi:hypothetical protein
MVMDSESDRLIRALADRLVRVAVVLEKIDERMQRSARAVEDIASATQTTLHAILQRLAMIETGQAVVVDNVKDAQRASEDVKGAVREVTGSFRTQQPVESKSGKFAAIGKAMLKARAGTLLSLAVLALAAAVAVAVGAAVYQKLSSVLGAHGG